MNRRLTVLIVVALSAAPVWVLPAQGDPRLEVFETPVRAQIQALVDSTRRLGLPTETLIDKALERRLKRTPSDGIVQAVRRVAATLVQAKSVLGEATDAEFDAAAAALRAGADPQTLIEMRRRRPKAALTTPFGLLESFLLKRVARDTAAAVILILTSSAMDDDEMSEFWRIVEQDIAVGILPSAAAAARVESLTGTRDLSVTSPTTNPPTGTPPPARPIPPQRP